MLTECTRSDICLEGRGSDMPAQGIALGIGSGVENSNALKGRTGLWSRILFRPFRAGRILIRIGSPGPTPQAGFPPPGLSCFGPFGAAEKARLQNLRRGGKGSAPPSQGGERDCSLATSFHPAQQKHVSRNRPSSSVNTDFSPAQGKATGE